MISSDLVATCWTSAGRLKPLDEPEVSDLDPLERVAAVAGTGWAGMGFSQGDLAVVRDTVGFPALARAASTAGLRHVEVELASGWWLDPEEVPWRETWEMLLDASEALGSPWIKVGTTFGPPMADTTPLVDPLRRLADEAAARGARVALEPLPFAMVASVPQGADLVRAVDHEAAGLCVDFWHVFRAGTTLAELARSLDPRSVFGVEVSDADPEPCGTLFEDTRDNRRYPGRGSQDVVGFLRTMDELGYHGPWGVEILSEEHRGRPLREGLVTARESMLAVLDAARA